MSRIGNTSISIPEGVNVSLTDGLVLVKGPKGELSTRLIGNITVEQKDNELIVKRQDDEIASKAFHGLIRSLINNNVIGVSQGYKKTLKLVGNEKIDIHLTEDLKPSANVKLDIHYADGTSKSIEVKCRIDTANELEYYKNGGILHYVLRKMSKNISA